MRISSAQRTSARAPLALSERARGLGVEALADDELLALLVTGVGNRKVGAGPAGASVESRVRRVLHEGGGLVGLSALGVGALCEDLGLGVVAAARVAAALELAARLARSPRAGVATSSAADVERWARTRLVTLRHEELWLLLLDAHNMLRGERLVARGGVHALAVTAADVLRPAVREAASGFVLVHNHPSGDPCPSREDVVFTQRISGAARHLGIPLVDHVVVGCHGYVSMLEAGLLEGDCP